VHGAWEFVRRLAHPVDGRAGLAHTMDTLEGQRLKRLSEFQSGNKYKADATVRALTHMIHNF
jgi:hypothetical protein